MNTDKYYRGSCGAEMTTTDANGTLYCPNHPETRQDATTNTDKSNTPRTDAATIPVTKDGGLVSSVVCKQLERELSAARSDLECQGQAYSKALDDLAAANKRLEAYRVECRARGLIGVVAAIDGKEGK